MAPTPPERRGLFGALLAILFPARCVGCRREGAYFCAECERRLAPLDPPYCLICGQPGRTGRGCSACRGHLAALDGIRAGFLYQGPARAAIHQLKYRRVRALAPVMGRLLADRWQRDPIAVDVVVPVPLHRARARARGYNQADLIGAAFGAAAGLPIRLDMLSRVRETASQVETGSPAARRANVAGAFAATGDARGLRVLLLDDVCTTGATLNAAAAALKQAGATAVWGLVFAREA